MDSSFFERPILNSPYAYPGRHWELDPDGQPTGQIIETRRKAKFITPIPKPKKHKRRAAQERMVFDEGAGVSTAKQQYDPTPIIDELRRRVDQWRAIGNPSPWGVTPETARLLQHWRHHEFTGVRPFFCQIEAAETAIWLTEVAPNEAQSKRFLEHLANANNDANPELMRLALKLATGAGKTTVMAMLIAWQTVNAVRRPQSKRFTRGFLVLNDEAHHCYREKPRDDDDDEDLRGDDRKEAERNNEAARLWISGLEAVNRKLGLSRVIDLSATPFFLRGSGYAEGTLFPWTVCDFSLMDAIECGIVKLPRVPVADNVPGEDMPIYRNLWEHIGKKMPKKGRGKAGGLDPLNLPVELQTALDALYGHYTKTYDLWQKENITVPPVFIVVCNNTSTSKLVHDYVSGFYRVGEDGTTNVYHAGRLELFRNYDDSGNRLARPRTLLIDSEQLESGDALDTEVREMAADEIERFRREMIERGDVEKSRKITDQDLLREVMNTVGKEGKLGESIRCVVSVSMLTEGWDANTVTHILGVRAFGTQLLCEQVVGGGLRRQSYELDENKRLTVEYADILGIPFDFTAKPVVAKAKPPRPTVRVCAIRPDRDALEIKFPRVEGYRVELPEEQLSANFTKDSTLELNPKLVGPSKVLVEGIVGKGVTLSLEHLKETRPATIVFHLTKHLLLTKYRDPGKEPKLHLFGQLKAIVRQWLDGGYLRCTGGTFPAQVLYREIADMACERIKQAITETLKGQQLIKVILDPYNPEGSTSYVDFPTSKRTRWKTDARKCHVNWVVCDSDWEAEFCRVAEAHPRVRAYVKNQGLGLEVPYLMGSTPRKYLPDFIVQIDDGQEKPLNLIVEIKGFRGEDAKDKANTMRAFWIPGVNNLGKYGRWQFVEFTSVFDMDGDFDELIESFAAPVAA